MTVSPYLGADSLEPFVDTAMARDAGIFVLVKTSNPGGGLFQDLKSEDGQTLYQCVAAFVQQSAERTVGTCGYGAVGRGCRLHMGVNSSSISWSADDPDPGHVRNCDASQRLSVDGWSALNDPRGARGGRAGVTVRGRRGRLGRSVAPYQSEFDRLGVLFQSDDDR